MKWCEQVLNLRPQYPFLIYLISAIALNNYQLICFPVHKVVHHNKNTILHVLTNWNYFLWLTEQHATYAADRMYHWTCYVNFFLGVAWYLVKPIKRCERQGEGRRLQQFTTNHKKNGVVNTAAQIVMRSPWRPCACAAGNWNPTQNWIHKTHYLHTPRCAFHPQLLFKLEPFTTLTIQVMSTDPDFSFTL